MSTLPRGRPIHYGQSPEKSGRKIRNHRPTELGSIECVCVPSHISADGFQFGGRTGDDPVQSLMNALIVESGTDVYSESRGDFLFCHFISHATT